MQYVYEHTNFRKKAMFMPFLQGRTDRTWRTLTVESCPASASTVSSCVFFSPMEAGLLIEICDTFRPSVIHYVHHMIYHFIIIWTSTSPSLTWADPRSYVVELLTCKSRVFVCSFDFFWPTNSWRLQSAELCHDGQRCKEIHLVSTGDPEIHQELQDQRTSWDWWEWSASRDSNVTSETYVLCIHMYTYEICY